MDLRGPDYLGAFRCLAGACPHTCCAGWAVEIDPASAAFYRAVPGPLGDRLRASLTEEDGAACFRLAPSGRCPFLDGENLCELHRALGQERTGAVCRSHPRFTEDYGPLREISLAASCPAARDLLLGSRAPLTFPLTRSPEPGEPADPWLAPLLSGRERAFALLRDRARPLPTRLADLLVLADGAQALLDADRAEDLPALCRAWSPPPLPPLPDGPGLFPHGWAVLGGLECLGRDWRDLLEHPGAAVPAPPDWALERIAAYFVFRYWLKAVNDGDLLGRAELAVFAVLAAAGLSARAGLPEALRIFSREVEHDADNLAALLLAFRTDPALSLDRFFLELGKSL